MTHVFLEYLQLITINQSIETNTYYLLYPLSKHSKTTHSSTSKTHFQGDTQLSPPTQSQHAFRSAWPTLTGGFTVRFLAVGTVVDVDIRGIILIHTHTAGSKQRQYLIITVQCSLPCPPQNRSEVIHVRTYRNPISENQTSLFYNRI